MKAYTIIRTKKVRPAKLAERIADRQRGRQRQQWRDARALKRSAA